MFSFWHRSTFGVPNPHNSGSLHDIAVLDVDADGDQDLVFVTLSNDDTAAPIRMLINDGAGAFSDQTSTFFPSGAPSMVHSRDFEIADFNGDGRPDLFIAGHGYDVMPWPGEMNILLYSDGANGFVDATGRLPDVLDFSHSSAIGDVNGDGFVDILVMNINGGTPNNTEVAPYFLINDGTGNFTQVTDALPPLVILRDAGHKATAVLLADVDNDGDNDLIFGTHGEVPDAHSRILLNPGDGDFSSATEIALPNGPFAPEHTAVMDLEAIDLDGDGALDLLVNMTNNYQGWRVQVLMNDGAGNYSDQTAARFPQHADLAEMSAKYTDLVDLNGDGHLDLMFSGGTDQIFALNDGAGHFVRLPANFIDYDGWDPMFTYAVPLDANGDGRMDVLMSNGNHAGVDDMWLYLQQDPGSVIEGGAESEALIGDDTAELLQGLGGDDVIFGAQGADQIDGGDGDDYLNGGADDDIIQGGAGADVIQGGAGADYLVGGSGADRFVWRAAWESPASGGGFDAVADFETGVDVLDFTFDDGRVFIQRLGSSSFVYFDQQDGGGFGGVAQVVGAVQGADIVSGGPGVFLYGQDGGADDLSGGAGADVIVGFSGDDVISGGAGADALYGGAGNDIFVFSAVSDSDFGGYDAIGDFASAEDRIDLSALVAAGQTNIALAGFGGSTFVYFGEAGQASFNGVIVATGVVQGRDLLLGQALGLTYYGSDAAETLGGGDGDDTLLGGAGADVLFGGDGADALFGGSGADIFLYDAVGQSTATAWDTIQDFEVGLDRIDLRGVADSVSLSTFGGNTFVYFNPNGSGGYDGLVIANGVTLSQDDILVTGEAAPGLAADKDLAPLVLPGVGPTKNPAWNADEPLILPAGLDGESAPSSPGMNFDLPDFHRDPRDIARVHGGVSDYDWIV